MRYWVGIDVGKEFHRLCVLDEEGEVVLSERVGASERELEAALSRIAKLGSDERIVGSGSPNCSLAGESGALIAGALVSFVGESVGGPPAS